MDLRSPRPPPTPRGRARAKVKVRAKVRIPQTPDSGMDNTLPKGKNCWWHSCYYCNGFTSRLAVNVVTLRYRYMCKECIENLNFRYFRRKFPHLIRRATILESLNDPQFIIWKRIWINHRTIPRKRSPG